MPPDSPEIASASPTDRPANTRSRVSNGRDLLPGVDGRSAWVRRARDLVESHTADLGGDLSAAESSIVRRAAVLTVELERMEATFANESAAPEMLDLYSRTAGNLRRLLEALGLQRRVRDLTPDPLVYARSKAA